MTRPLAVRLAGIGLLGPGFADWRSGADALFDPRQWRPVPTVLPVPLHLPPAERRRAGAIVKLSLAVAEQACAAGGIELARLATVFASSSGDAANCHALCEALAAPERVMSPTRFTNSVHNAPAGYWHIATTSRAASTSLGAGDASFGAGLLEAMARCVTLREPVLLVAADVPYPAPLHATRPLPDAFGVALLLLDAAVAGAPTLARLELSTADAPPSGCADAALEALRAGVPAARALPLLQALACGTPASLIFEASGRSRLHLRVEPGEGG